MHWSMSGKASGMVSGSSTGNAGGGGEGAFNNQERRGEGGAGVLHALEPSNISTIKRGEV